MPWFCSNYVQLCAVEDFTYPATLDFFSPFIFEENLPRCPLLEVHHLNRRMLNLTGTEFIEFIINQLEEGYYVYAVLRSRDIPNYGLTCDDQHHPLFIYGYDDDSKVFLCGDFFQYGVFKFETVGYNNIASSFEYVDKTSYWWNGLKLLKRNQTSYNLDIALVLELFWEYKHSVDSSNRYKLNFNAYLHPKFGKISFGLSSVYQRILGDLIHLSEGDVNSFDYRAIPILADHKKAMCMILDYVSKQGDIDHFGGRSIMDKYCSLYQDTLLIRNIMLKYRVTNNRKLLLSSIDKLKSVWEKELH